jgi:hypothetical protein
VCKAVVQAPCPEHADLSLTGVQASQALTRQKFAVGATRLAVPINPTRLDMAVNATRLYMAVNPARLYMGEHVVPFVGLCARHGLRLCPLAVIAVIDDRPQNGDACDCGQSAGCIAVSGLGGSRREAGHGQ